MNSCGHTLSKMEPLTTCSHTKHNTKCSRCVQQVQPYIVQHVASSQVLAYVVQNVANETCNHTLPKIQPMVLAYINVARKNLPPCIVQNVPDEQLPPLSKVMAHCPESGQQTANILLQTCSVQNVANEHLHPYSVQNVTNACQLDEKCGCIFSPEINIRVGFVVLSG